MIGLLFAAQAAFVSVDRKDPITDTVSALAILIDGENKVTIGCPDVRAQTLVAGIEFSEHIAFEKAGIIAGGADVQYRFDDRPAVASRWNSVDKMIIKAGYVPANDFIKEVHSSSKLHVRLNRINDLAVDLDFNYISPDTVIDEVLAKCGFTADGKRIKGWNSGK